MDLKRYIPFTIFFSLIFVLNLLFFTVLKDYSTVVKVMIMASLIGFYIMNVEKQENVFTLGMIFALLGDAFLQFESKEMFLIGLGCFLIMQICYSYVFAHDRGSQLFNLLYLPCILIAILLLYYMIPHLGDMKIGVFIYIIAILTMVYFAFHRSVETKGYHLVVLGAIFFLVSDAFLAWGKFVWPIAFGHYIVMITYMLAQYLIVRGMVVKSE